MLQFFSRRISKTQTNSDVESVAIQRLVDAHKGLIFVGQTLNPDLKSHCGREACALFLNKVGAAAEALKIQHASRSYRLRFTVNYRVLFKVEDRSYRLDVLNASIEQHAGVWLNGEKFDFSADVKTCAQALMDCWKQVMSMTKLIGSGEKPAPTHAAFKALLQSFDESWIVLEQKYITELIQIEEQARRLIVDAIQYEKALQHLESDNKMNLLLSTEYREAREKLIRSISKLNSVANSERKGRSDLSADILDDAHILLHRCTAEGSIPLESSSCQCTSEVCLGSGEGRILRTPESLETAQCLANDVIESYWHVRYCLSAVSSCLERVDPDLRRNADLVHRLVDWEESWEIGRAYVQNRDMLRAICGVVGYLRQAADWEPALARMIITCDVGFCLCLPRLCVLLFLGDPAGHTHLLGRFLPQHFGTSPACSSSSSEAQNPWDDELDLIIRKYNESCQFLASHLPQGEKDLAVQQFLVRWAVVGPNCEDFLRDFDPALRSPNCPVESMVRCIEKCSITLQRHCPEDWNQFMAVVVHCFGAKAKSRERLAPYAPVS